MVVGVGQVVNSHIWQRRTETRGKVPESARKNIVNESREGTKPGFFLQHIQRTESAIRLQKCGKQIRGALVTVTQRNCTQ